VINTFTAGVGCGKFVEFEEDPENNNRVKFIRSKKHTGRKDNSFGASGILSKDVISKITIKLFK